MMHAILKLFRAHHGNQAAASASAPARMPVSARMPVPAPMPALRQPSGKRRKYGKGGRRHPAPKGARRIDPGQP
jgi:hypothetical protein